MDKNIYLEIVNKAQKATDGIYNDVDEKTRIKIYGYLLAIDDMIVEYKDLYDDFRKYRNLYNKSKTIIKKIKESKDEHLRKSANSTITVAIPTT